MNRQRRNNNNNKKNNKNNKNKKRRENRYVELDILTSSRVPRNLKGSSPFPPTMTRKMTLFEPNLTLVSAANFGFKEWRINSAFDPDPVLGGGTIAGYNELAKIYNQYRVEKVNVKFSVANNETVLPITFGLVFRDIQPSTKIINYADAVNALEVAPTTGPFAVGINTGMDIFRSRRYKISLGDIVGDELFYRTDGSFQALVTVNPAALLWMAFIFLSPTAVALPLGLELVITIEFTIKWFSGQVVLE